MSELRRGLLWMGGGVLAVVLSRPLYAIGSLLGIILFPVGTLSIAYGILVLIHRRKAD